MRYEARQLAKVAIIVLTVWATASADAAKKRIRFIDSAELPGLGIKLKLMPHSTSLPLPSPKSFHYTFTRGEETWEEELLDPAEIWFQSQHAGRWTDEDGNTLTLAAITQHLPREFPRKHVSAAAYEQALSEPENHPPATWNSEALERWVRDFVGTEVEAVSVRNPSLHVRKTIRFKLAGQPPTRIAYAVHPILDRTVARHTGNPWIMAIVDLANGVSTTAGRATVEQTLLGSIRTLSASTYLDGNKRNGSMQSSTHDQSDEAYQCSRAAAIRSIQNMDNWWYAETAHYIILSDLTSRHRPMIKELQEDVEALWLAYNTLIPPISTISAVSVIRMPSDGDMYVSYAGEGSDWTGGMWMPALRELIIRPVDSGSTRDQRRRFLKVAYHEAFHQYLFYALGKRSTPPWFNEGHAGFFEDADVRHDGIRVDESEVKVERLLQMLAKRQLPFRELLAMDYPEFYDPDAEKRADNYTLAWALIYYLRKGASQERPARYHKICDAFLTELSNNSDNATEKAFRNVNMQRFEKQFRLFWKSKSRRSEAKRTALTQTR
jgi:hypothetical protein